MDKYEQYLNDVDTMKIAYNAASSFRNILTPDEIQSCVLKALFRAVNKYDKSSNAKFTSYLYNGVRFECLGQAKINKSDKQQLTNAIPDPRNPMAEFEMKDVIESTCDDPELIFDRFYKNMTITEIAKSRKVCGETVRIRIGKNLEKMRIALKKSV
jgi:DNA-directed RNA polymerase specialized sigma subunit